MFAENDTTFEQMSLFNSTYSLTPREQRFLDRSWAKPFSEIIFPAINEKMFSVLYSEEPGRKNTPVNICVGALILQQLLDLSDDEILNSLLFDIRFQYALHTLNWEEQPLSDRTLGRFRARCELYEKETGIDLIYQAIIELTDKLAQLMKIDRTLIRMDSMMIAANIKKMTRLELLYSCTAKIVKVLAQQKISLDQELAHYTRDDDRNKVIYHNRGTAVGERIDQILKDAVTILALCKQSLDDYENRLEYQLFVRVLKEQAYLHEDGTYHLRTKSNPGPENQKMNSGILQNPADPDATFREKDGKSYIGYAANLVEAVSSDNNHGLILDYSYDTNNTSDQDFGKRALESMPESENEIVVVADGLFSGEEIEKLANEKNIKIVNTNLSGKKVPDIYSQFKFDVSGTKVLECPAGEAPVKTKYYESTNQCIASFDSTKCKNCPLKDQCKPKINSKTSRKAISVKAKLRAEKQMERKTEEFSKYSNFRNGVEALPSLFRSKLSVDNIHARGKLRSKLIFGLKVAAVNCLKFCKYCNSGAFYAQNTVKA